MSTIINSVNECYLLNKKVNNLLKIDILEDQYTFIILEVGVEDSEITPVEGVLLCNTERIANLIKMMTE